MKTVKVVQPHIHPGHLNFKLAPYRAWISSVSHSREGTVAPPLYPPRFLHGFAFKCEIPKIFSLPLFRGKCAILMFVEPVSLYFDTFPYYVSHEIIPMFWDCWPCYYDKVEKWLRKHNVKTAIFTSRLEMEEMKTRIPELNTLWCPEAVDTSLYKQGKDLKDRNIDLLEFGRSNTKVLGESFYKHDLPKDSLKLSGAKTTNHVCTQVNGKFLYNNEELYEVMGDAKITICLPKSMTHPDIAEGVETLTQRYWEAMLSRMVIVGHAPKELVDFIGYNPVIEIPDHRNTCAVPDMQNLIAKILEKIDDYQELVDRNRETALNMGGWNVRMKMVREWLSSLEYE
ncbi:MAG: hypothetical protein K2G12_09445 [Prevotella sp.]|nr:hypothetical protein [Prevotella sp.]